MLTSCESDRSGSSPTGKELNQENVQYLKILIDKDGIYELSSVDLAKAGMAIHEPSSYHLYALGKEVPFWLEQQPDGFTLRIYAQESRSLYTNENIYWLVNGGNVPWTGLLYEQEQGTGVPIARLSDTSHPGIYQASARVEENLIYLPQVDDGEYWFWAMVVAPQEQTYEIALNNIAPGIANLRMALWSRTDTDISPEHHLRITINSQQITDEYWDGKGRHIIEKSFPSDLLVDGINQITIDAPGDTDVPVDINHIDWIEIDYPRLPVAENDRLTFNHPGGSLPLSGFSGKVAIYDITDPSNPTQVIDSMEQMGEFEGEVGNRYLAIGPQGVLQPSRLIPVTAEPDLRAPGNGADYIVIGPPDLLEPIQPLLDWRVAQGLKVVAVPVSAIYDQFKFGLPEPEAIQEFVKYAAQNWSPRPQYVLLVGDSSYDPKGYLAPEEANRLPTFFVSTFFGGQTSSDVEFTQINEDPWPDISLGHIPARNAEQVTTIVDKILSYEKNLQDPSPQFSILAVADGQDKIFQGDAQDFLDQFPSDYPRDLYAPQVGEPGANRRLQELMKGDNAVVAYFGHGSINMWGKDRLFTTEDVAEIKQVGRFPVVVNMTCLTGLFTHPNVGSLAEAFLFQQGGGAVAVLAPSSLTLPTDQSFLSQAFVEALLDEGNVTLGQIHLAARRQVPVDAPGSLEVMQTFMLFGDPALVIDR